MSWAHIDDHALTHPKIFSLVRLDHPFDLWVWGLVHSKAHTTDGLIVRTSVPKQALKAVAVLVAHQLWEEHPAGWIVHDYLDWNDCRALIEERKEQAKARKEAWLERRQAERQQNTSGTVKERVPNGVPNANGTRQERNENDVLNLLGTREERIKEKKESNTKKEKKELPSKEHSVVAAPKNAPPDPRIRDFLVWFQSEYKARRFGADYCVDWGKHGVLVKAMLGATTYERLQTLAKILLSEKTDDPFIVETDRGIEILKAKFNWLSDRLTSFEARKAVNS